MWMRSWVSLHSMRCLDCRSMVLGHRGGIWAQDWIYSNVCHMHGKELLSEPSSAELLR